MPIIFVENMLCFGEKCSCLNDGIKMFITNKVLFVTTEEKRMELLTLVMASVRRNTKYIFFMVLVFVINISPS